MHLMIEHVNEMLELLTWARIFDSYSCKHNTSHHAGIIECLHLVATLWLTDGKAIASTFIGHLVAATVLMQLSNT